MAARSLKVYALAARTVAAVCGRQEVLTGKLPTLVQRMADAPDAWPARSRQPVGNGGCHQDGVVCTSMRSTHLTHQ
jgi:hypothetical protein